MESGSGNGSEGAGHWNGARWCEGCEEICGIEYHSEGWSISMLDDDVTTNGGIEDCCSCTVFGRSTAGCVRYAEYSR